MNSKRERFMESLAPLRGGLEAACRHLLWDKGKMEDCLQTAILEAYAGFDRFEDGSNFRAWIYRYLWNTVMNHNRRHDRIRRIEGEEIPHDAAAVSEGDGEALWQEALADPDLVLDRVDDRIKRSLLELNPPERATLILRATAGLAYKEIARILDIPIGSVMGYLHRARTKLRRELSGYVGERGLVAQGGRAR
ncbi:MAG: sigma-70 family RNA polymerase sigma factor [Planctomycetes bacterium]|nr:sigma-70 family RNA polymerase sigma factor [Planctomycetota bacterium]